MESSTSVFYATATGKVTTPDSSSGGGGVAWPGQRCLGLFGLPAGRVIPRGGFPSPAWAWTHVGNWPETERKHWTEVQLWCWLSIVGCGGDAEGEEAAAGGGRCEEPCTTQGRRCR